MVHTTVNVQSLLPLSFMYAYDITVETAFIRVYTLADAHHVVVDELRCIF